MTWTDEIRRCRKEQMTCRQLSDDPGAQLGLSDWVHEEVRLVAQAGELLGQVDKMLELYGIEVKDLNYEAAMAQIWSRAQQAQWVFEWWPTYKAMRDRIQEMHRLQDELGQVIEQLQLKIARIEAEYGNS